MLTWFLYGGDCNSAALFLRYHNPLIHVSCDAQKINHCVIALLDTACIQGSSIVCVDHLEVGGKFDDLRGCQARVIAIIASTAFARSQLLAKMPKQHLTSTLGLSAVRHNLVEGLELTCAKFRILVSLPGALLLLLCTAARRGQLGFPSSISKRKVDNPPRQDKGITRIKSGAAS